MWKVYSIQTGQIVKAGFPDGDAAKSWLEEHREGREDNYLFEEMDEDEETEWTEAREKFGDEEEDQSFERERYNYSTDDVDDGDDGDNDGMMDEDLEEDDD